MEQKQLDLRIRALDHAVRITADLPHPTTIPIQNATYLGKSIDEIIKAADRIYEWLSKNEDCAPNDINK